jgi:hypothetical protein
MEGTRVIENARIYGGDQRYQGAGTLFGDAFKTPAPAPQAVTINVNNGNVTAQDIVDAIRKANRATGTNVLP